MAVLLQLVLSVPMEAEPWQAVNDGVMGGLSSGRMVEDGGSLRFEGELSLENNGGFASVRRFLDTEIQDAAGVRITLRGDGRRYQFRLRQDGRFDGVTWRAEFDTGGDWQTVELLFTDFAPVFRGRPVPEAGPVLPERVRQIGFMVADKREGPFALEIRSIEFGTD